METRTLEEQLAQAKREIEVLNETVRILKIERDSAKMSERTSELIRIKAKFLALIEEIGDWRSKHELMSDDDFNEVVLSSVEFEDAIDLWIIKSMDENLNPFRATPKKTEKTTSKNKELQS